MGICCLSLISPVSITSMAGNLSIELLFEILGYVSKGDLKSIRLASKSFYMASSQLLFARVHVSVHLKDLEILSEISQHLQLRLLVREIVYAGMYFSETAFKIQGGIRDSDYDLCLPKNPSRGLQYYFDRLEEQSDTMNLEEDVAIICAALARMPNLQKVTFTNHWEVPSDFTRARPSPTRDCLTADQRHGGPFSRTYPDYAEKPTGLPITFSPDDSYGGSYDIDHGFRVMCRALSIANTRLNALSIDYMPNDRNSLTTGIAVGSFDVVDRCLDHFCNAFRSLRKIKFSLSMVANARERDLIRSGNIPQVLAAAQGLEDLSVAFPGMRRNAIPLDEILGTQIWPLLHSISFVSHNMHEAELRAFVERHLDTLRNIRLDDILLKTGSWQDLAVWIRTYLPLERVSLHDLRERKGPGIAKEVITSNLETFLLRGETAELYGQELSYIESLDPDYTPQTPIRFSSNIPEWI